MIDAERYERLRALFHEACELRGEARRRFLDRRCADDAAMRAELETLLENDDREAPDPMPMPERLGPYRIVRKIAEGGMGTIYEAEQEAPRRTVALKVIRSAMASQRLRKRFEYESNVLALLRHPGIAQIYQAGTATTAQGPRPYFAMELVRGENVVDYANRRELSTRDRLELLARICDAVHHAHQKGVIHRDLKPSNILVDESGRPRILDFGIARATDADLTLTTLTADVGRLVGTIAYMSPEQAAGGADGIDTRSDVYAIGVLAYELLAGELPYKAGLHLHEAVLAVREQRPTPLGELDSALRGDVETIVAKALEKDRASRYDSAAALAADVWRYLNDEPIVARPPSAAYQMRKFAKRHRSIVATVGVSAALLVLSTLGTTIGVVLAVVRGQEAQAASQEAATIAEFLTQMFESVDPDRMGDEVLVRDILDEASTTVSSAFPGQPRAEAQVRHVIARGYHHLGNIASAIPHLEIAFTLRTESLGPTHPKTLEVQSDLGAAYLMLSRYNDADTILVAAVHEMQQVFNESDPRTLTTLVDLGRVQRAKGDLSSAERHYREALSRCDEAEASHVDAATAARLAMSALSRDRGELGAAREHLKAAHQLASRSGRIRDLLTVKNDLGLLLLDLGDFSGSARLSEEALTAAEAYYGEGHSSLLTFLNNLAVARLKLGDNDAARDALILVLQSRRESLGDDHIDTISAHNNLALFHYNQGQLEEAEDLWLHTLDRLSSLLGTDHRYTLINRNNLGLLYTKQGRFDAALSTLLEVLQDRQRTLGDAHLETIKTLACVGQLYASDGRYEDAIPILLEAISRAKTAATSHADIGIWLYSIGECFLHLGLLSVAETVLLEGTEVLLNGFGPAHPVTQDTITTLAQLYDLMDRPDDAAKYWAMLETAEEPEVVASDR